MRASLSLAGLVLVMSIGLAAQQPPAPAAQTPPGPDEVAISFEYTGPSQVSEKNRIWVWLFDNPDISAQSTPIGAGSIIKNGDTVKFKVESTVPKVYVAAAYDNVGGFMGDQAPPPGTPIVVYGRTEQTPAAPLEKGSTTKVKFDDSVKMQ